MMKLKAQTIPFLKMHGLGNDFAVVNGIENKLNLSPTHIQQWADRHTGIGFDQLLIIRSSIQADFACQIYNSDGSEAEQCGNGLRCVAAFIKETDLSNKKSLRIETKAGIFSATHKEDKLVEVVMGIPSFQPERVPFNISATKKLPQSKETLYGVEINSDIMPFTLLGMGNPHAILCVESVNHFPVGEIGQQLAKHPVFPQGVNVGFMQVQNNQAIRLRTFERGAGETLACGSNACASVVAGILNHSLANKVKVSLARGDLWVEWAGEGQPVIMTGPAEFVYAGKIAAE